MRSFFGAQRVALFLSVLAVFPFSTYAQPGITLNGHLVPKDSLMLFIDVGNSTMSGRDKSPDLVTDPHLWKFEMSPTNYDWLAAKEPICVDAYNKLAQPLGGPIMPFLKELHVQYPTYYFGVMQLSNSGWELTGHFNYGQGEYDSLMKYAKILLPNVTIAAIVCMLNTVEVQINDTLNYLQKVIDMVGHMRSDLGSLAYKGIAYTVPYIHAGYPVLARSNTTAKYDTSLAQTKSIIRQIAQIPGAVSNSVIIPTDSCPICTTCTPAGYLDHYDHVGNVRWGTRAADTVKARGWIPPAGVGVSQYQQRRTFSIHTPLMQKVLFDGTNWPVFDKAGKSFSVFAPNGRTFSGMSAAILRNQKLLPGVYFVRRETK